MIIVFFLSFGLFFLLKKTEYFTEKEKEMVVFVIDMYLDYGEEIGIITDNDKQEVITKELKNLKKKYEK